MRVDKYLWCVRFYKTRNKASQACKKGHVFLRESKVKPSQDVFEGDILRIRKNQINFEIKVTGLPSSRVGAKLVFQYYMDQTPQENVEHVEKLRYAQKHYRKKGLGRPTKKDRRELDEFLKESNDKTKEPDS